MAKKDAQDFRVDFIEAVGRTENLRVLRNISSNMLRIPYTFNLNMSDVNDYLDEGLRIIKKLLGKSANSFLPFESISETSPQSYFGKIAKGYRELEEKEKSISDLNRKAHELELKISKYKEKGKFDKAKEYELRLSALNYPKETLTKIDSNLEDLDNRFQNSNIDEDIYVEMQKNYNKLSKIAKESLKIREGTKETENILFLNKMQEGIRRFLCSLFFKKYGKMSDSPNRFLLCFDGETKIDFEHMLLLYNYLKFINYKDIHYVKAVLYYFALEQFYRDVSPFLLKREFVGINLKDSPTEFYSEKYSGYCHAYIPAFLVPEGYRGYVFEPKNLAQQSFIAAINKENLTVDSMVSRYKLAQDEMKRTKNGIFFSFLDKDLENRLLPKLITNDFPLNEMDGKYKDLLLEEFEERRKIFGYSDSFNVMINMYSRVVKPYALEVLGSYVRTFCSNLNNLADKKSIYIYYVSPQRIAIAVRDDINDEILRDVFDEKFISNLTLLKKPILDEIVSGKWL